MANVSDQMIAEILQNVASDLKLKEFDYSMKNFEKIGQNYFGVLIPVELIGKVNGEEKKVQIVLKLAPTDERYRVSGALTTFFLREIFVYSTLIKEFQSSERKLALEPYMVPACYYVCRDYCREVIALQDMTAEGYQPYTASFFLDYEHVVLSLKSLATFHAHSFILKHLNNQFYEDAIKVCVPLSQESNKRYMDVLEDRLQKALATFAGSKYIPIFKDLKDHQARLIEAAWNSVADTCICHGDIWKENILFKYQGSVPISVCLIDYQTARVSSPAYDVLYLITSSTDAATRREHFSNFINIYYTQLDNNLTQAGLESHNVYSKESFRNDLKTVAPACAIVANTALWLASGCQQEGHVRSKRVLDTEEERKAAIESYRIIIKDIVDDFVSYGYI
ncbi:ecdysteroid kinase domain-containing protein [Phthorimaea operculella]|nr:ecdysteroid kinase domain-containing protein [Phthorimaea operculella]